MTEHQYMRRMIESLFIIKDEAETVPGPVCVPVTSWISLTQPGWGEGAGHVISQPWLDILPQNPLSSGKFHCNWQDRNSHLKQLLLITPQKIASFCLQTPYLEEYTLYTYGGSRSGHVREPASQPAREMVTFLQLAAPSVSQPSSTSNWNWSDSD